MRAKEHQKAIELAGINFKKRPNIVQHHYDDSGDDLSGLGDDIEFPTADLPPQDWIDDESDDDAETIV